MKNVIFFIFLMIDYKGENLELSQNQTKFMEIHQKQMELMKKELDDGYHNVINEFQRQQTRLQKQVDHLKRQLIDSQQTIEQLKLNLNRLKNTSSTKQVQIKKTPAVEEPSHLSKLLEQSNNS